MADDRIEIEIALDDGSVRRGFANIKKDAEDSAKGASSSFSGLTKTLTGLAAAYLSITAVKNIFSNAINEAIQAENSVNKLNNSLKLAGLFSEGASKQFQDLASELQKTTTFSDEAVLGVTSLALNYAKTTSQAEKLTKASLDLATATGVDVDTAVKQLGGTLNGNIGLLGKLSPELKLLTKNQLEAGEAVDILANRFKGAAVGAAGTFDGRITQLSNTFSDFLEVIGSVVTKSPATLAVIGLLAQKIVSLTDSFSKFTDNRDFAGAFISTVAEIGRGFVTYLVAPAELAFNIIKTGFLAIAQSIVAFTSTVGNGVSSFANFIAPDSAIAKALTQFAQNGQKAFDALSESLSESAKNTFSDFSFSTSADKFLEDVDRVATGASASFDKIKNGAMATKDGIVSLLETKDQLTLYLEQLRGPLDSVKESFDAFYGGFVQGAQSIADNGRRLIAEQGAQSFKTLANGVTAGMAAIGKALVTGENLFKAFAGALLGALGQALVAEGGARILQGLARAFGSYGLDPTAQGLIATGSAMTVAGGALQALGTGGGAVNIPTSASGGAGASVGGVDSGSVSPDNASTFEQQQKVTVNIQGDVLDSKETGLRIVDILNDAFNSQGAKVLAT